MQIEGYAIYILPHIFLGNIKYCKAFAKFMDSSGSILINLYTCLMRYHMYKLYRNLCNKDKYFRLPIYQIYSEQILRKKEHKFELTFCKLSFSPHTK